MTKQKKLILSIVEESQRHPSAEEIFSKQKKVCPTLR